MYNSVLWQRIIWYGRSHHVPAHACQIWPRCGDGGWAQEPQTWKLGKIAVLGSFSGFYHISFPFTFLPFPSNLTSPFPVHSFPAVSRPTTCFLFSSPYLSFPALSDRSPFPPLPWKFFHQQWGYMHSAGIVAAQWCLGFPVCCLLLIHSVCVCEISLGLKQYVV